MRGGSRLRTLLLLVTGALTCALAIGVWAFDLAEQAELDTVDARFSIRGDEEPPADLLLVHIDDVTFDELGLQWPFPRSVHAKVVDRIAADDPKAIAFDVQFTEQTEKAEDIALIEAVANASPVVLSTTEVGERGETAIFGGIVEDIGARAGNTNLPPDEGGVNRRVPYEVDGLESFAVATAEVASGRAIQPGDLGGDTAWIDFHGPPGTIPAVSYSRVRRGRVPRGLFRDKLVVIGASAPSLQDVAATSTTGEDLMAGPEIQANAISTARRGFPLQPSAEGLDVALILLLGMAAPVASIRLRPLIAIPLALLLGAAYAVAAQLAFEGGTILPVLYPLGALALATVGAIAVHAVTAAFERERVRDLFSRFVPENVVDDVLARADGLRLGGVQREGTVMFSDLRGFTSFAESLPVDRVIQVLNRYLSEMSDAILDHGGTLVAYMGDGIMAVFGAPIEQPDHADRAMAAARDMLARLERFNDWLRSEGLGDGFKMGIGLNSGPVMSGNVGSERRLEYTAIGDTTNTAARLEGMTKGTPYQLYLADSTRSLLREATPELADTGEHEVRGREARIRLWGLER